jgi:NAD(P)H-dependent flavin oxidoreductase YrpB (nitropropane dioxygenase family)
MTSSDTDQRALATRSRRLGDLLGIGVPVLGAPMGGVAGPDLAAAVSNAGGLGVLGHANLAPDRVRDEIRRTRALTDRPFGIGLLFPSGAPPRRDPAAAPPPLPDFLRELGEPDPRISVVGERTYDHDMAAERLEIAIAEGVPVLTCGLGVPESVVERAHRGGMVVVSLVGSLKAARAAEARGVDAIVAQGHEAGGHTGRTSTLVLVPQVVDAVRVPVIAAGGIVDGRTLAAALMLGAEGALVGTALIATPEAQTAQTHKTAVVEMLDDDTVVSRTYTGKPSRVIRNRYTEAWKGREHEVLPMPAQWEMVAPLVLPAKQKGSMEIGNWPTGQGAVLVRGEHPAGDVVRAMAAEAEARLSGGPAAADGEA